MNKTTLLLPISLLVLGGYACNSQPGEKTQAPSATTAPTIQSVMCRTVAEPHSPRRPIRE